MLINNHSHHIQRMILFKCYSYLQASNYRSRLQPFIIMKNKKQLVVLGADNTGITAAAQLDKQ